LEERSVIARKSAIQDGDADRIAVKTREVLPDTHRRDAEGASSDKHRQPQDDDADCVAAGDEQDPSSRQKRAIQDGDPGRIATLQEIARAATIGFGCVDLCANVARQTSFRRGAAVIGMTALSEYTSKAETLRDGC
jgi:hypothetical protein